MRPARLAILSTFLVTVHSVNLLAQSLQRIVYNNELAVVRELPIPTHGSAGTNSVKGPISDQVSPGGVNKTEDMLPVASSDKQMKASSDKQMEPIEALAGTGVVDAVAQKDLSSEKVDGLIDWNLGGLAQPLCRNCEALINYEWLIVEYGRVAGTKAFLIVLAVLLIWMLATTAQDFFVPPLLYWCQLLNLSPEIAGVTLLALGNGAPDIFAVCTAAQKDLPLALSEMMGSNMFTLCITGGVVITSQVAIAESHGADAGKAPPIVVSGRRLGCTLGFYGVTLFMLWLVVMHGEFMLVKAVCLPLIYGLYVVMMSNCCRWFDDSDMDVSSSGTAIDAPAFEGELPGGGGVPQVPETVSLAGLAMPKNASPLQIAYWYFSLPSYLVRWSCIPPVDNQWGPTRRMTSAIAPLGLLAFCAVTDVAGMQEMSFISLLGFTMLACLGGFCIYFGSDSRPVLPWFYPALPLFALVSSVLWMEALATEITALVEAIGFTMEVPRLRLGFTAIAWGNSIGDLLVCMATAQHGHPVMAITAIFAGPLIDDLIAFGGALVIASFQIVTPVMCGADCKSEFKWPVLTSFGFIFGACCLLCCLLRNQGAARIWCSVLVCWYVLFLVIVIFVEHVDAPQAVVTP